MWIFTSEGFISAVAHRDDARLLLIRARKREHLVALFGDQGIEETPGADYRYRKTVTRPHLEALLIDQVRNMAYDNFKNSIQDDEYHAHCSRVWSVMYGMQAPETNRYQRDLLETA